MASLESAMSAATPLCFDGKWKICKEGEQPWSRICPRASSGRSFPVPLVKPSSSVEHRRCSFTRKCSRLVREQRARFYIMRRCVTMLICWRDYGDY
ncbi:hypothetical protein SAY87_023124 [Trapa incisa]|uniref:Uncharacterized protein n=2 Tax=Trapa TaxID=22665 RepID=A0AAN7QZZ9_TRANT|nr:hypothetical protein SAY87_023124 [Trapa incisa]KAK4782866.1 hypothetical protein SAY86_007240 [Trapa natans]